MIVIAVTDSILQRAIWNWKEISQCNVSDIKFENNEMSKSPSSFGRTYFSVVFHWRFCVPGTSLFGDAGDSWCSFCTYCQQDVWESWLKEKISPAGCNIWRWKFSSARIAKGRGFGQATNRNFSCYLQPSKHWFEGSRCMVLEGVLVCIWWCY